MKINTPTVITASRFRAPFTHLYYPLSRCPFHIVSEHDSWKKTHNECFSFRFGTVQWTPLSLYARVRPKIRIKKLAWSERQQQKIDGTAHRTQVFVFLFDSDCDCDAFLSFSPGEEYSGKHSTLVQMLMKSCFFTFLKALSCKYCQGFWSWWVFGLLEHDESARCWQWIVKLLAVEL